MLKKISLLALTALSIFALQQFCHKQTDGFAICKIRTAAPSNQEVPSYREEDLALVKSILAKPLTYIGRGGQCYAFATDDNKYVVKLLKYNNNTPKIWFRLFPFPFGFEKQRQEKIAKKAEKLKSEYASYTIALNDLKTETGIVYFHLDKGTLANTFLQIQDKLHISHCLDADSYEFYIQKKGTPFYPKFEKLIEDKNFAEAKAILSQLVSYLFKRCDKKITDGDDGIWRNFAFQDNEPFQIDIGQFSYHESLSSLEEQKKDLLLFTKDFREWLEKTSPYLAEYLLNTITSFSNEEKTNPSS